MISPDEIALRLTVGEETYSDRFGLPPTTYASNDWYGHRYTLNRYVGLRDSAVRWNGYLQHGWAPCCGLEGEQGYKGEVIARRSPAFVWARHNLQNAKEEGIIWARAIGAPFLYLRPALPVKIGCGLLVFPPHGTPGDLYAVVGWAVWARELMDYAKAEGFCIHEGVTVCLHPNDWKYRHEVEEAGATATCLGSVWCPDYLQRFVGLVGEHSMVLSDRICTAGFYAMYLRRVFKVGGPRLDYQMEVTGIRSRTPEPETAVLTDREWIGQHFPGLLRGAANRELAEDQLGAEFVLTPHELRARAYAWLPPTAFEDGDR